MTFKTFSQAVHARYTKLAEGELFIVDVLDIYDSYLAAFPEGTNPIFRTRTEHDCNCCKQFIRRLGQLVAILLAQQGYAYASIWRSPSTAVSGSVDAAGVSGSAAAKSASVIDVSAATDGEASIGVSASSTGG